MFFKFVFNCTTSFYYRCYWEVEDHSQLVVLVKGCIHGYVSHLKIFNMFLVCGWNYEQWMIINIWCIVFVLSFLYCHSFSATKHFTLCSFLLIITLTFLVLWYADLNVLNQYPQFHSISAFNNIYNDTGIFGIQVTTVSPFKYCPLWNHDFLDIFKDLSIMK